MKLDLLTNATVVDDAIRFVSGKSKEREDISSNYDEKKELNELIIEKNKNELYTIASEPTVNKTF